MRWMSDLRDDEANSHLVVKRTLEGTGVDEEECLQEILRVVNGAAAGKQSWIVEWCNGGGVPKKELFIG